MFLPLFLVTIAVTLGGISASKLLGSSEAGELMLIKALGEHHAGTFIKRSCVTFFS